MKKIIGMLFLVLFIPSISWSAWTKYERSTSNSSITLSTVTKAVRVLIDDPSSEKGTVRYSSATLYNLINTAQRLIAINTMCLTAYATQALTVPNTNYAFGNNEYLLPDDCIAIERVTIDLDDSDGPIYIPQKVPHHMDVENGKTWAVTTTSDTGVTAYYLRNRHIGMYPYPVLAGHNLAIWYIRTPSLMDSEGDYIFDGYTPLEAYWHALVVYAAYQILLQEGKTANLDRLASEFTGAMMSINTWIRYRPDYMLNFTGSVYPTTTGGQGNR